MTKRYKLLKLADVVAVSAIALAMTCLFVCGADKPLEQRKAEKVVSVKQPASAPMPTGRRLRDIVADKYPKGNLFVGATIGSPQVKEAGIDLQILNREFSYTTPENDFKQQAIYKEPGGMWNWSNCDLYLENCAKYKQAVRIHGPISPQVSKWALDDARTPVELKQMLEQFLTALYQRYNGKPNIRWVDVVNETVAADGRWFGPKPGVKDWENPWTIIGSDSDTNKTPLYISQSFALAQKYAPNIKLVYNHHTSLEKVSMERVKETILYLRGKGLRVDALGWQAHVKIGWEKKPGNLEYLSEVISWAHANKLEFHITENTVHLPKVAEADENERAAATFAAIFRSILEHRDTGVVTWNCWHVRDYLAYGTERTGLLFAEDGSPNKAYYEIQSLLENPPPVKKLGN